MNAVAKQSVLLVDDEPQILVALEDLLEEQFTIFTANSAEAALDVIQHESEIAVVVTDQRMPRMSGDELVAKLNGSSRAQRIMVTGYADLSAVIRAVNDGRIFAYVTKPWNEQDLRVKVTQAANQFSLSRQLDAERQLLHDLMDNSPDGIYFKDKGLKFRRANRAFSDWIGQQEDELKGRRLSEFQQVFPDIAGLEAIERRVMEEGKAVLDVVTEIKNHGSTRWVSEMRAPVRDSAGRPVGLVGISRDVTAQLQLEQQLLQSQKMEAVGRLAGGVAHDFNNLLAVIQSYGTLVMDSMPEADPGREDMEELLKATERAAALTKQLLTFSRRQPRAAMVVDMDALVVDIAKMLRRLIDERVKIVTRAGAEFSSVRADRTQLEQIVLNLAINARDAMVQGGVLTIETANTVDEATAREYVRLSVEDTGTGIPPEVVDRIFEPFFSTKDVGKGTGLGLSTVYGIVKQAGGHVKVNTEVGRGTRFDIYLPAFTGDASNETLSMQNVRLDQGGETILIVEDEDAVRRVAVRILRKMGYRTLEAASAGEALRIVIEENQSIDLLLSDVVMPEMLGTLLYGRLEASNPGLRVLFMSGYADGGSTGTQLPEGAALLEKPFTPNRLAHEVRNALSR